MDEFFEMLKRELSDDYFAGVQYHLSQLKFRKGVLVSARLGKGNKGSRYVLRRPPREDGTWLTRLFAWQRQPYSFSLDPRDEGGARALSELQDRGISLVAQALAQAADHVSSFFEMLRTELAFYVGCINLHSKLLQKGGTICNPSPMAPEERRLSFQGLYDVSLALSLDEHVVGNDANADGKDLVIVTGANQGGKSTFLRSIGLAQLMMECGMFTPAESFCSSVCDCLFTHYKREEDVSMKSGKLDEELSKDEPDRRSYYATCDDPIQRVLRSDQRARRLRDRHAHPVRVARQADQDDLCHPSLRVGTWFSRPKTQRNSLSACTTESQWYPNVQADRRRTIADKLW
jgi:hypothetical protein